ncbi:MAG: VOC family protein [Thermomicrobiales bacterium]|nr:VOC family protein [Thermomicrobiales bacterium]
MSRSLFQLYVRGSREAVELYQRAFDANVVSEHRNEDGTYLHVELDIFGQIVALSEAPPESGERVAGTTMQLCFHMGGGKEDAVRRAYEILQDGAEIDSPLGESFFSPLMFGLIDRFGVNWNLFI